MNNFDMVKKRIKSLTNVTTDTAFTFLGVALLLMFPKNFLYPPYWVALASWTAIDLCSEESKLKNMSEKFV
jgi:hypothetical protein